MPMGGPMHKGAMDALEQFRRNGLYNGSLRGNMLGTAFYPDSGASYREQRIDGTKGELEGPSRRARNNFWTGVLAEVNPEVRNVLRVVGKDEESKIQHSAKRENDYRKTYRAIQIIYELVLEPHDFVKTPVRQPGHLVIDESGIGWHTVAGIVCSELTAVGLAVFVGVSERVYWLAAFFLRATSHQAIGVAGSCKARAYFSVDSTREASSTSLPIEQARMGLRSDGGP